MKRLIAAAALAATAVLPGTASAAVPLPGGQCDGYVDTLCRDFVCGPDDLDCGMIPPCLLWVYSRGCVIG